MLREGGQVVWDRTDACRKVSGSWLCMVGGASKLGRERFAILEMNLNTHHLAPLVERL